MSNLSAKLDTYTETTPAPVTAPHASARAPSALFLATVAALLYCLSFGLTTLGLMTTPPAPDEMHWVSRSNTLLVRIKNREFGHVTTHLPHPGIPGAFVMAVGEVLAGKWNALGNQTVGSNWYLDPLSGARLGASLAAAGFAPLVFLCAVPLFGVTTAFFAALLFTFDPYAIAIGRQAHIDAMLSICISLSALCFIRTAASPSYRYQFAAAVLWGLALAGKPTAVLLLPAFAVIRVIFWLGTRSRLVQLRDVWSVVIGVGLFTALYSRLWYHWGAQPYKLNPWPGEELWVDRVAPLLQQQSALVLLGASLYALCVIVLERRHQHRAAPLPVAVRLLLHATLVVSISLVMLVLRPEILRNLTGYSAWVFGLKGTAHFAYGRVWDPPPYGYAGLLAWKLPSAVLIACALGLVSIPVRFRSERLDALRLCALLAVCVCIAGGLNISSKQAYRYLLPILPLFYLLAASGCIWWTNRLSRGSTRAALAVASVLALWQAGTFISWREAPELYHNSMSGGLAAGMTRGSAQAFAGQRESIAWLQKVAERENRALRIGVVGDFQAMQEGYLRMYPAVTRTDNSSLRFHNWTSYDSGEYVVVYHSILRRLSSEPQEIERREPLFQVRVKGVAVASVYRPMPPRPGHPLIFPAEKLPRRAGRLQGKEGGITVLTVKRGQPRDFLFYNAYAYLEPGDYELQLAITGLGELSSLDQQRLALRVEFGSQCERLVPVSELSPQEQPLSLRCSFDKPSYVQLRGYWFGYVGLGLRELKIVATNGAK